MRKFSLIFGILTFLVLLTNCGPDESKPVPVSIIVEKQGYFDQLAPRMDNDHLVVRFPPEWTKERKNKFKDSLHLLQDPVKKCPCGDPNIEFLAWDQTDPDLDIQSAKNGLTGGPGNPQGDEPFNYILPLLEDEEAYNLTSEVDAGTFKAQIGALKASLIATDEDSSKVNIVVIDTGIDYYKNRDMAPFLYSTKELINDCGEQKSGWNFVDTGGDLLIKRSEVEDDHGHGTYVTRLITSELEDIGMQYRILPIKAFNSEGVGNYWDIVCALSYIHKLQEKNQDLHVINASFGYSFFKSLISEEDRIKYAQNSIVKELIDSLNQSALVIASAGNVGNDTNISGNENYPASFTSENIIGIGGYIQDDQNKELAGNFGNISIDAAAPFSDYRFTFKNENGEVIENVQLIGSSYSAAFTSAKIVELIKSLQSSGTPHIFGTPTNNKTIFLDPANNWVKTDPSLDFGISEGRYQEK